MSIISREVLIERFKNRIDRTTHDRMLAALIVEISQKPNIQEKVRNDEDSANLLKAVEHASEALERIDATLEEARSVLHWLQQ